MHVCNPIRANRNTYTEDLESEFQRSYLYKLSVEYVDHVIWRDLKVLERAYHMTTVRHFTTPFGPLKTPNGKNCRPQTAEILLSISLRTLRREVCFMDKRTNGVQYIML